MRPLITLLTDFGTADGYVGEMKGVLLSRAPDARVVDITHEIPAQDVELARLTLARVWRRFPADTVHLVVVDPGVGTDREALAVKSDGRYLVGPDNGVLSPALLVPGACAVTLEVPASASASFHGRDVFAPAAASLASGASLESLGTLARQPTIRRTPEPHRVEDGVLAGVVISVDRFGNAITNLVALRAGTVEVTGATLPLRRTYGDVPLGAPLAIIGSSGLIEIAVRDGSAARQLNLARGSPVVFRSA
ncbi:MAG TPA: SAM-dependent chlorinase/fluorinase [Gemmatimonadaceae bacterium]|nr:SAM-dependent chlorinase/fluorinase [Gemmatimonadaceae bacterium]